MENKTNGNEWADLVALHPELVQRGRREWRDLDGHDWVALLQKHPECADKCDKWDQFDTECWEHLLRAQPQFADKCDKWDSFESLQLFNILCDQPSLFDKVREWGRGYFDGPTWVELLCYQPHLADRCNWRELDYVDWVTLLSVPDPLQLEFRCSVGRGWGDPFVAIEYIPQSDDALRGFHGKDGPCYFKKLKWEDIPLRIVSFLLRLWPSFTETAKRQKNVKGKILEILFDIPADEDDQRAQRRIFPIQLWRQHVAAGDHPEDEPDGHVSSMESSWYAEATPGNAEIRVFLDGEEMFSSPLDFANPKGLAFKDCGFLFDESNVDDDGLVYSSRRCLSEAASWEPMVEEVPPDFKFEPEKLFVPFYRARVSGNDGFRLLVRPSGIRYGDMKQSEWFSFDEHPELVMENPSYVCSFWPVHWTVSEGAAKPYDEDDWWEP